MLQKIKYFLFKETEGLPLSIFRFFFGIIMLYQIGYYFKVDYPYQFMYGPELLFKYPLLNLDPISKEGLNICMYLMLISSLLITIGFKTRWFSFLLLIIFSYFTFIDQTLYNNHLYLFIIITGLFTIVQSDNSVSILQLKNKTIKKKLNSKVPNWNLFLFQFMIFVTYFYGGLAKLNNDWLSGNLPELILSSKSKNPSELLIYFIAYGGVLFDLSIGFLLLYKRTFLFAFISILIFNITNGSYLFDDIGIFPLFMVASTVLFIPKDWIKKIITKFSTQKKASKKKNQQIIKKKVIKESNITLAFVSIFVLFQVLFPLRHYLITNNPEWTGIGTKFSWRMKMQHKKITSIQLNIIDGNTNTLHPIDYTSFLTKNQQYHFVDEPIYIIQLAHFLKEEAKNRGMNNIMVKSEISVSMNGREEQIYLDPNIDLASVPINRKEVSRIVIPLVD